LIHLGYHNSIWRWRPQRGWWWWWCYQDIHKSKYQIDKVSKACLINTKSSNFLYYCYYYHFYFIYIYIWHCRLWRLHRGDLWTIDVPVIECGENDNDVIECSPRTFAQAAANAKRTYRRIADDLNMENWNISICFMAWRSNY
jgi:hypothetical protein